MGMAHPRSCSWLFEKEGGSARSVQLYKHDKLILSYEAWAWSSLGDILQGQVCRVQVSSPDRRQMEGYILIRLDSFILTVTFWGLPKLPMPSCLLPGFQNSSSIWFGTSPAHQLGISMRIPREWFPWQQQPHGRFQNFYLLLMVLQKFRKRKA